MAYLEVKKLSIKADDRFILSDISFTLEKGTITLLAGKNGSGKSMLLKCLKGLVSPHSGKIYLDGKELKSRKERIREIGLVFQETSLQIVGSTVEMDIAFGPENLEYPAERIAEIVDENLKLFDLEKYRTKRPDELSGGERRKLILAGVIAMEPSIILLDEPFANLDYPSIRTVIRSLDTLKKKGFTILLVSHEAEKFLAHTDKTIIIRNGRIASDKPSRDSLQSLRENDVYVPDNANFEELSWLR